MRISVSSRTFVFFSVVNAILQLLICRIGLAVEPPVTEGRDPQWIRQLGTTGYDESFGAAADGFGNVYITGRTGGTLGAQTAGGSDVYLSKYDTFGNELWTRQFGSNQSEFGLSVTADFLGNAYVTGYTEGTIQSPRIGENDGFLAKYDQSGNQIWVRQFGTNFSERANDVFADDFGNIYVAGVTDGSFASPWQGLRDAFVTKYDTNGVHLWSRQLGTNQIDEAYGVTADSLGNVYISGFTTGSLGRNNLGIPDAFIAKYDASSNLKWIRQFGTNESDIGIDISADDLGNVYLAGSTTGSFAATNAGGEDLFISKLDPSGVIEWTEQIGSIYHDAPSSISTDNFGNIYIVGSTSGNFAGTNADGDDGRANVYLLSYDGLGNRQWGVQFGTPDNDFGAEVSADRIGNVFVSGSTDGNLGDANAGRPDAFVAKFIGVPEPTTGFSTFLGAILISSLGRRRDECE